MGGPARAPYPRPEEVRGTDEVTSQRYLALATLKGPQNLSPYDPDLAAIPHPQNLICIHIYAVVPPSARPRNVPPLIIADHG